jgi:hypothetical protein
MKSGVRAGGSRSSPAAGTVLASSPVSPTTSAISGALPNYFYIFNSDLTISVVEKTYNNSKGLDTFVLIVTENWTVKLVIILKF